MLGWAQRWLQDLLTQAIGQFVDVAKESLKFSLRNGVSMSKVKLRCRALEDIPGLDLPVAIESGEVGHLQLQIPWMNLLYGKIVLKVSGIEVVFRERGEGEWEGELAKGRAQTQKQALLSNFEMDLLARAFQASREQASKANGAFNGGYHTDSSSEEDAGEYQAKPTSASAKAEKTNFNFNSLTTSIMSKVGKILLAKLVICVEDVHVQYQDGAPQSQDGHAAEAKVSKSGEAVDAITANFLRLSSSASASSSSASSTSPSSASSSPKETKAFRGGSNENGVGNGEAEGRGSLVKIFGLRLGRLESVQEDQHNHGSRAPEDSPTTLVTLTDLSLYTGNVASDRLHSRGARAKRSSSLAVLEEEDTHNVLEPMTCTLSVNVYHGDPHDTANPDYYEIRCNLTHVHLNIDNELLRALIVLVDKLEIWQLRSVYGKYRPIRWRTLSSSTSQSSSDTTAAGNGSPGSLGAERSSQWAKQGWRYALLGVTHGIKSRYSRPQRLRKLKMKYPFSYGKYVELYKQRLVQLASGQSKRSQAAGFVNFLRDFEAKEEADNILALRAHVEETMDDDWVTQVQCKDAKSVQDSVLTSFWHNWMASGGRDEMSPTESNFSKLEEIYDKLVEQMPRTPRHSTTTAADAAAQVICSFRLVIEEMEVDILEFKERKHPLLEVGISSTVCKIEVLETNVTKASVQARDIFVEAGGLTLVRRLAPEGEGQDAFVDLSVEAEKVGRESHLSLRVSCIIRPFVCSLPPERSIERFLSFEIPIIETYHLSWLFSANQLETDIARSHAKAQYLMQYPYVNFQLILSEVCLLLSGGDQMEASSWETEPGSASPGPGSLVLRAMGVSATSARHDVLESSSKAQLALEAVRNRSDVAFDLVEEHVMYHRLNCTITQVEVGLAGRDLLTETENIKFQEKLLSTSLWTENELLLLPDDKTQAVCKANADFSGLKVKISSEALMRVHEIIEYNALKMACLSQAADQAADGGTFDDIGAMPDDPGSFVDVRVRFPSIAVDLLGFQGIQQPMKDHLKVFVKGLKAGVQSNPSENECFVSIASIKVLQKWACSTDTLLNLSLQELAREDLSEQSEAESTRLYENASRSFKKVTPEKAAEGKELFKGTLNERTWVSSALSVAVFEKKEAQSERTVILNAFCARINTKFVECVLNVSDQMESLFASAADDKFEPRRESAPQIAGGGTEPKHAASGAKTKVRVHISLTNYIFEVGSGRSDAWGGEGPSCSVRIPKMNVTVLRGADSLKSIEIYEEALSMSIGSGGPGSSHPLIQKFDISTKLTFRPLVSSSGDKVTTALDLWIQVPQLEMSLHQDDTRAIGAIAETLGGLSQRRGSRQESQSPQPSSSSDEGTFPSVINGVVDVKYLQCEMCGIEASSGSIIGLSEDLYIQVNVADKTIGSFECGWRFLGLFLLIQEESYIPSRVLLASLQPKQHGNEIPIIETNTSGSADDLELSVKNVQVGINAFCWDKAGPLIKQLSGPSGGEAGQAPKTSGSPSVRGLKCLAEDLEININFEDVYDTKSPPVLIRTRLELLVANGESQRQLELSVHHMVLDLPLKGTEEDDNGDVSSFKTFAFLDDMKVSLVSSDSFQSVRGLAHLESLSLWVSHKNLSFLNMALSSLKRSGGSGPASGQETALSQPTGVAGPAVDVAFTSKKFAALFSDDRFQRDSPIAEIALCDVAVKTAVDPATGAQCSVTFALVLDFYNYDKVAWEPVIEEWPLEVFYSRDDRKDLSSKKKAAATSAQKLAVKSGSQWNINVSEYTIETANILWQMLESLNAISDEEVCSTPKITSAKFTPYWLQNQTGLTVGYCFTDGSSSSVNLSELNNKEEGQAPDENLVPLYIRKSSGRGGRYVSYKHMNRKMAAKRSLVSENHDQQWVSGRRPVIHFKIRGSTWSPSVAMNTYAKHCITLENVGGVDKREMDILCDVQRRANGGRLIVLHSCISISNSCGFCIQVGSQAPLSLEPKRIKVLAPGESFWVPVQIALAGSICLRMMLEREETNWSQQINLSDFVGKKGKAKARRVLGNCIRSEGEILSFTLNTDRDGNQYKMRVEPPVKVRNWLPVPLDAILYRGDKQLLKSNIKPDSDLNIHNIRNPGELSLFLRPQGYSWGDGIAIPFRYRKEDLGEGDQNLNDFVREGSIIFQGTSAGGEEGAKVSIEVKYVGVFPMILQISCPLWIYNHTGLKLGVRDRDLESRFQQVLPYLSHHEASGEGTGSVPPKSSEVEPSGLGIIARLADDRQASGSAAAALITYKEGVAGARTGNVTAKSATAEGKPWPTMFGLRFYHHNIQLQLRVKPDPSSDKVVVSKVFNVEVLGEPTVVHVVASEPAREGQVSRLPKAYFFTVSTEISTFGGSSIGVHVRPRFILTNRLGTEIIYRQEGSKLKHVLRAGGTDAVHGDILSDSPKLCVKLENNAVWSGFFQLDKPGGIQMKMSECGEEESTMLQVDIRELSFETWTISISEYQAGFAPYRIDNFTSDILSYYQYKCESAEGMLHPYSSAVYTWDEPYMSHKLVIKLPGYGSLGSFPLDKVGSVHVVSVPVASGTHMNHNIHRNLQISVAADGPTRVLAISDLSVHVQRRDPLPVPLSNKLLRITKMNKKLPEEEAPSSQDSAFFLDVQISHLGLSVIGKLSEIVYLGMLDLCLTFEGGEKRDAIAFTTRRIQIDNMLPNAALPVLLSIPAPLYQQEHLASSSDAITFKLSYWHAKVASVMCIESAEIRVPPILLDMDGSIFLHLHHFSEVVSWVEETASLTRVSSASSLNPKVSSLAECLSALGVPIPTDPSNLIRCVTLQDEEATTRHRLHFESIKISPIHITASLSTAGLTSGETFTLSENPKGVNAQLLYALTFAEFEGVQVLLSGFELNHALIDRATLQTLMSKHYIKALLREAVKILGSANVLGDPLGLVQHLGTGMWDFLSKPTVGLFQSALTLGVGQFTAGVSAGSWSLLSHTVYALSNAAWKISKTAHRNVNVVKTR